jgi:hypothetical protein
MRVLGKYVVTTPYWSVMDRMAVGEVELRPTSFLVCWYHSTQMLHTHSSITDAT